MENKQLGQVSNLKVNKQEQNILLKITNSIIGTLDFEEVLQIISDGMAEILGIETGAIYLLENKKELYLGATTPALDPMMPDALRRANIDDHPHIKKTITTRLPLVLPDTQTANLTSAEKNIVELRKLRSLVYFPFVQKKNVLGILILSTIEKKRNFSQHEVGLGQTIANQLSIGIQNARLHHDLQQKNNKLITEIEERKKVENALRNSEAHLSNALRIAKLGHWEYDVKKNKLRFTDEFFEIYKTSAEEQGGYTMNVEDYTRKFVHPANRSVVNKEIQKAIETKEDNFSAEVEHKIVYSDGQIGEIVVRYQVIKDKNGNTIKIIGANQDITQRKAAENELINVKTKIEESEYKYRSLFDQAAEGIFLMTAEGELIQANKAFAQMHGYSIDEILKFNIHELDVRKEKTMSLKNEITPKILAGESVQLEVEHFHKNGHTFPLSATVQSIQFNNTEYLLCFHQDLTKQKQIENELKEHRDNLTKLVKEQTKELDNVIEELKSVNEALSDKNIIINQQNDELKLALKNLKETQAKLIQSEKMASLGVLTAGVAHEINNPLNFIMGSYIALESYFEETGGSHQDYISKLMKNIKTGLDRASGIVKGLNQFSRDSKIQNEDCKIHAILNNCLSMLNNRIKNNIEVKKSLAQEEIVVKGNVGQLHQVFINILMNAIQAIDGKGNIALSTKLKNKHVIVEISDNGEGINKKNLTKITEPFFTTRNPGEGTGLGLSITYSIIKEHKGNIEFESKEGKGTKVIVTLPLNRNN